MKTRRQSILLLLILLAMSLNLYQYMQVFNSCNSSHTPQTKVQGDRMTLVTAYYKVPSKHSHSEFLGWMEGLLQTTDKLVIFTEEWLIPVMEQAAVHSGRILNYYFRMVLGILVTPSTSSPTYQNQWFEGGVLDFISQSVFSH